MLALSSICVLCLLMVRIQDMWFVVSLYSKTKPIVVFLSTFNYYYFNGINLFTFDYDMRHSWLFWSTVQLQSKHFCEMLEVCRFLCVFPMYSIVLLPPCKQFIGFPNVSGSLMTLPNRSWFQMHWCIANCYNVILTKLVQWKKFEILKRFKTNFHVTKVHSTHKVASSNWQ